MTTDPKGLITKDFVSEGLITSEGYFIFSESKTDIDSYRKFFFDKEIGHQFFDLIELGYLIIVPEFPDDFDRVQLQERMRAIFHEDDDESTETSK